MFYSFLEPFIREHFMLGPFRVKRTYLSLPVEGLRFYRCTDVKADIFRNVYHSSSLAGGLAGLGVFPIYHEFMVLGNSSINRIFRDLEDGSVEVSELHKHAHYKYHYDDGDHISWISQVIDRDENIFEARTEFNYDDEDRLIAVERRDLDDPNDRTVSRWCKATIEYRFGGELILLTIEATTTKPEFKLAIMFSSEGDEETVAEFARQEPGVSLIKFEMTRKEFEYDTDISRFLYGSDGAADEPDGYFDDELSEPMEDEDE